MSQNEMELEPYQKLALQVFALQTETMTTEQIKDALIKVHAYMIHTENQNRAMLKQHWGLG